ncbi:hypothetical protein TNCV_5064851 [Trichonephila clavipes]|nr:hypothetical protein TNCV_5064851 [Trichonephila clavipes]
MKRHARYATEVSEKRESDRDRLRESKTGREDISEHIPIEESLTAQQHTLSWDEEQYLVLHLRTKNVPFELTVRMNMQKSFTFVNLFG